MEPFHKWGFTLLQHKSKGPLVEYVALGTGIRVFVAIRIVGVGAEPILQRRHNEASWRKTPFAGYYFYNRFV